MNQLSNLLGDVYGDPDGPPVVHEPAAEDREAHAPATPEWADDEHLDAAFENWQPAASDEAEQDEREFFGAATGPLDADLAATLSAALADAGDDGEPDEGPVHGLHAVPDVADAEAEADNEVEPQDEAEIEEPEAENEVEPEVADEVEPDVDNDVDEAAVHEHEPDEAEAFVPAPPPLRLVPEVHNDASSVAALYAGTPVTAPAPVPMPAYEETAALEAVAVPTGPWQRSDDDILPARRQRGGLKLRLRR